MELALAALDLRSLAHQHRGESRRMPELASPPRVAYAPAGVLCVFGLTVTGPTVSFEPGELSN